MRQRFLYIVLMLSFASQVLAIPATTQPSHKAMAGTVVLQDDEIKEILTSRESYAYFGTEVGTILDDLPLVHQGARQHNKCLDEFCALIAAGRATAPTKMIKAALEEAAQCLAESTSLSSDEVEKIANNIENYYKQLEAGDVELIVNQDTTTTNVSNRSFTNKLFTGSLTVAGDLTVKGNENVYGNLTVRSNGIFLGDLSVGGNETIGGNLTVNGQIISTNLTGNAIINGGQPGPLTIGTNNATSLTFITNNVPNLSVNAAGNVTIAQPISGNTLTVNGTLLTNTIITTTASFAAYLPPYAPLTGAMAPGSNVAFYGDSITQASYLPSPTTQRWTSLVSNRYGVIENNFGVGGNQINDLVGSLAVNNVYGTRPTTGPLSNVTTFLSFGINDIDALAETDFNEQRRTLEAATLFCCLPTSQKVAAQAATQSGGVWAPVGSGGYDGWGVLTNTNGASLTVTVTGRFVCFAAETFAPNFTIWDVLVDGGATTTNSVSLSFFSPTTFNGTNANDCLWVYDTGSSPTTTHTIQVTRNANSNAGQNSVCTWFAGFNLNNPNCNTVFIVSPTEAYFAQLASPANGGTEARRDTMIRLQQRIARKYRTEWGLPVYFVDVSYPMIGMMLSCNHNQPNCANDNGQGNLHPYINGHQYMANRVINVIQNGEFNYLT